LGVVELLLEAVKRAKVFKRNKILLRHKVKAGLLYMAGLSTRTIAEVVRLFQRAGRLSDNGFTGLLHCHLRQRLRLGVA